MDRVRGRWEIREWEREARGGEGEERTIWKRGGGEEKFASAKRAPLKEGRKQGTGRGVKEFNGGEPPPTTPSPPPSTNLFIPLGKSTNAKIFRVMADFNPRRQYIGVYFYFKLLFIPKTGLQCHQLSKH